MRTHIVQGASAVAICTHGVHGMEQQKMIRSQRGDGTQQSQHHHACKGSGTHEPKEGDYGVNPVAPDRNQQCAYRKTYKEGRSNSKQDNYSLFKPFDRNGENSTDVRQQIGSGGNGNVFHVMTSEEKLPSTFKLKIVKSEKLNKTLNREFDCLEHVQNFHHINKEKGRPCGVVKTYAKYNGEGEIIDKDDRYTPMKAFVMEDLGTAENFNNFAFNRKRRLGGSRNREITMTGRVTGRSIFNLNKKERKKVVMKMLRQVAKEVHAVHAACRSLNDLKSENVMISKDIGEATLIDIGEFKVLKSQNFKATLIDIGDFAYTLGYGPLRWRKDLKDRQIWDWWAFMMMSFRLLLSVTWDVKFNKIRQQKRLACNKQTNGHDLLDCKSPYSAGMNMFELQGLAEETLLQHPEIRTLFENVFPAGVVMQLIKETLPGLLPCKDKDLNAEQQRRAEHKKMNFRNFLKKNFLKKINHPFFVPGLVASPLVVKVGDK